MVKTYEEGVIAGELKALEKTMTNHNERLNHHSHRLRILERVAWSMFGIIGFMQLLPVINTFLGK
jgi:hypothetical protein